MSAGFPKAAEAILNQAFDQLHAGLFDDAVDRFTECIWISPHEAHAFRGRAMAHFQRRQWKKAEADFRRARDLDEEDSEHWIGLGMSLAAQHQIYPAFEVFETLLSRRPNCIRAYVQLGLLCIKLGITSRGIEHLQTALRYGPPLQERRYIVAKIQEYRKHVHQRAFHPQFEGLSQLHGFQ